MKANSLIVVNLLALSSVVWAAESGAVGKHSNSIVKKGGVMDTLSLKPFGLSAQDLPKAKLFLASYSPKTGVGKERIEILGTGEVRLIRSENYTAPEEVVVAKVKPSDVAALLTLIESEGFLQMDKEYKGNSVYSLRSHISLTLPSSVKSVFVDNIAAPPNFERMIGAIKALAGMASPLALNRQYFFRL